MIHMTVLVTDSNGVCKNNVEVWVKKEGLLSGFREDWKERTDYNGVAEFSLDISDSTKIRIYAGNDSTDWMYPKSRVKIEI